MARVHQHAVLFAAIQLIVVIVAGISGLVAMLVIAIINREDQGGSRG